VKKTAYGYVVETEESDEELEFFASKEVQKLSKDLKAASKILTDSEARWLVNSYYSTQDMRKRYANQERAMVGTGEPHEMISWYTKQMTRLEKQIALSLDVYSYNHQVGEWMRANKGVGPVIAAGLLAHIDIRKAPTVGHIWRYAGLDPTVKWYGRGIADVIAAARKAEDDNWSALLWIGRVVNSKPTTILVNAGLMEPTDVASVEEAQEYVITNYNWQGTFKAVFHSDNVLNEGVPADELAKAYKALYGHKAKINWPKITKSLARRPWNSELKTLCWKIGDSFRKVSNPDSATRKPSPYGLLYRDRKGKEVAKNDAGDFAELAVSILGSKKIGKDKDAYWWYSGEWTRSPKFNQAIAALVESKKQALGDSHTEAEYLEMAIDQLKPALKPKLPPAHIDARAMRYAVKIFLSHLHEIMYKRILKQNPPLPYPIAHLGHVHKIEPFLLDEDLALAS
jgi:hypothetical protein